MRKRASFGWFLDNFLKTMANSAKIKESEVNEQEDPFYVKSDGDSEKCGPDPENKQKWQFWLIFRQVLENNG